MKPKLYDCFCFFNEDMLLKLRLDTLWDYVDYFVLCESVLTFSGKPKPLNFDITKFEKYKGKIRHLVVKDYPFETNDAWRNERFQRNYLVNGLFDAEDSDLILVSDVDEIPKPSLIQSYDPSRYLRADFEQFNYAYFLNNLNVKKGHFVPFYGSKITTYQYFKNHFLEIERVRSFKSSGIFRKFKKLYFQNFQVQIIKQGGWHFTWIGDFDRIIQKLEGFSHQEYNKPEYKDRKTIEDKIRNGEDILREGMQYEIQPLDNQFPEALLTNIDFYKTVVDTPLTHHFTKMIMMPVNKQNKIRIWSEAKLIDIFGLDKLKTPTSLMSEWLNAQASFSEFEQSVIQRIRTEALENIEAWAEEDLKMNFIAFVIDLAGLKATKTIRTFYDKTISATVEGTFLKTKTDFMIAKGILDLVKTPYFHFQEYKREKDPHGDPMAQLVEAFLIAQEINQNGKPLYGCCIVGRLWYFVTMEEKNYCVSMAYDCTDEKQLHQIIAVLRHFKEILMTRLID